MRNNTKIKKLKLSSESVKLLAAAELGLVAGAGSEACTTEGAKSMCLWGCSGNPC